VASAPFDRDDASLIIEALLEIRENTERILELLEEEDDGEAEEETDQDA
jgi:hypothetical protein